MSHKLPNRTLKLDDEEAKVFDELTTRDKKLIDQRDKLELDAKKAWIGIREKYDLYGYNEFMYVSEDKSIKLKAPQQGPLPQMPPQMPPMPKGKGQKIEIDPLRGQPLPQTMKPKQKQSWFKKWFG